MHTLNQIVRNALTVALLGMFSMSATQAFAAPRAATSVRHGPPCVMVDGQEYCQDGVGPECVRIDGVIYCTP